MGLVVRVAWIDNIRRKGKEWYTGWLKWARGKEEIRSEFCDEGETGCLLPVQKEVREGFCVSLHRGSRPQLNAPRETRARGILEVKESEGRDLDVWFFFSPSNTREQNFSSAQWMPTFESYFGSLKVLFAARTAQLELTLQAMRDSEPVQICGGGREVRDRSAGGCGCTGRAGFSQASQWLFGYSSEISTGFP